MSLKGLFKKPKNQPEYIGVRVAKLAAPNDIYVKCSGCKTNVITEQLENNNRVCPNCGLHYRMTARMRLDSICDKDSFIEHSIDLTSHNIIEFPQYDTKLDAAKLESGEREGVVAGQCQISGHQSAIFVMESKFMMGSMGSVVGDKITRLFEYALEHKLPVVGFTVSGGARMQEGIISLMQMAKTSAAVKRHSDAGLLYIVVLTDPTTGGVTASFANEADIILAEPNALIGFAGPRVIEQTIRQKLPIGFQRAEFLLKKGFVDCIVERSAQKSTISNLLSIHARKTI